MEGIRAIGGVVVLTSLARLPDVCEAVFGGTLIADEAIVDITPAGATTGATAVTISYLNRKGSKVRDIDTATTAVPVQMILTISGNTSRVYIELDQPPDGLSQVRVTQGPSVITQDIVGDGRVLFDVVPAP